MTTLHLGVTDIPYAVKDGTTTGEVAGYIEQKYHVMEIFFEDVGADAIARALEHSVVNAMEAAMMGSTAPGLSLTAEGEGEIESAFRLFLMQQELDGVMPGVPTAAALKGISHRFKQPYAKANPERPSFIDTGTYSASFRCWIEG